MPVQRNARNSDQAPHSGLRDHGQQNVRSAIRVTDERGLSVVDGVVPFAGLAASTESGLDGAASEQLLGGAPQVEHRVAGWFAPLPASAAGRLH